MGRLIDADRLRTRVILYFDMIQPELDQETKQYLVNEMHGLIEDMPTVDTERRGHWIGIDDEPCETYECDKCGYITEEIGCNDGIPNNFKYCPHCGALMEEVEE